MIDENILKYKTDIEYMLSPLQITTEVIERDSCYYLVVDGSKLFTTTEDWEKNFGKSFTEFIPVVVNNMIRELEKVELNQSCVEFRIGTIFDMMLRIKEYGDK